MTSDKKEKVEEIVKEQSKKVKGMYASKPVNYRKNFPDGGEGHGWSRHYDDPVKAKVERVTTEKGIEEMQNER